VQPSTDTGHRSDDLTFGTDIGESCRRGYRSVHIMTEAGKLIVRNHGTVPERSYFNGCALADTRR
jgi:hypothetical protein